MNPFRINVEKETTSMYGYKFKYTVTEEAEKFFVLSRQDLDVKEADFLEKLAAGNIEAKFEGTKGYEWEYLVNHTKGQIFIFSNKNLNEGDSFIRV
ncbi:MAG TPA: hypothetical protein PKG52_12150 [bacterium]|nr:hypothetical protein [bacterium]HPS31403.1 hypothetical protein [bacterium]